ncbi:hypothetical protein EV424DRAFT_358351 [Suillus variegatus]|nr:hypothetical protein EV424DRAFT_358351 [Suillus variegatus]
MVLTLLLSACSQSWLQNVMIFIHKTNDHTWLQAWAACNHLCSLHGLKSLPSSKYGPTVKLTYLYTVCQKLRRTRPTTTIEWIMISFCSYL